MIRRLSDYPASQTAVETPLAQSTLALFNKCGVTPAIVPRLAGSAPTCQFAERLGLPLVPTGLGHGAGAPGLYGG